MSVSGLGLTMTWFAGKDIFGICAYYTNSAKTAKKIIMDEGSKAYQTGFLGVSSPSGKWPPERDWLSKRKTC
jgi:hypothetical protein